MDTHCTATKASNKKLFILIFTSFHFSFIVGSKSSGSSLILIILCVIGGIMLAILVILCVCCYRRRKKEVVNNNYEGVYSSVRYTTAVCV